MAIIRYCRWNMVSLEGIKGHFLFLLLQTHSQSHERRLALVFLEAQWEERVLLENLMEEKVKWQEAEVK